ncbi:unnamed protein product [Sphagnum jensenii]|uniref:Uncharacterized protein n=1 Tax=Sphagnum jensenii TaxID=128206 RepID=A0ABP1BB96_9BRYO
MKRILMQCSGATFSFLARPPRNGQISLEKMDTVNQLLLEMNKLKSEKISLEEELKMHSHTLACYNIKGKPIYLTDVDQDNMTVLLKRSMFFFCIVLVMGQAAVQPVVVKDCQHMNMKAWDPMCLGWNSPSFETITRPIS